MASTLRTDRTASSRDRNPLYSSVIGLASLAVLLQGLWAGLFIQEGKAYKDNWVTVHAHGGEVALALTVIATVVAFVKLRSRKDLLIGSAAMVVLLLIESYIGGEIGDHPRLTIIHIPLAMALMALSVWLPMRATRSLAS